MYGFPDGHVTDYENAVGAPLTILAWVEAGFGFLFLALAFTPIGTAPTTRHGPAALLPSVDLQLVGQVVHVVTATESSRRQ
jgi:hypothetical protein